MAWKLWISCGYPLFSGIMNFNCNFRFSLFLLRMLIFMLLFSLQYLWQSSWCAVILQRLLSCALKYNSLRNNIHCELFRLLLYTSQHVLGLLLNNMIHYNFLPNKMFDTLSPNLSFQNFSSIDAWKFFRHLSH